MSWKQRFGVGCVSIMAGFVLGVFTLASIYTVLPRFGFSAQTILLASMIVYGAPIYMGLAWIVRYFEQRRPT